MWFESRLNEISCEIGCKVWEEEQSEAGIQAFALSKLPFTKREEKYVRSYFVCGRRVHIKFAVPIDHLSGVEWAEDAFVTE